MSGYFTKFDIFLADSSSYEEPAWADACVSLHMGARAPGKVHYRAVTDEPEVLESMLADDPNVLSFARVA